MQDLSHTILPRQLELCKRCELRPVRWWLLHACLGFTTIQCFDARQVLASVCSNLEVPQTLQVSQNRAELVAAHRQPGELLNLEAMVNTDHILVYSALALSCSMWACQLPGRWLDRFRTWSGRCRYISLYYVHGRQTSVDYERHLPCEPFVVRALAYQLIVPQHL